MNEAIKQLAEQAGIETVALQHMDRQDSYLVTDRYLTTAKLEKLVELIATECMALCTEQQDVYRTFQLGTDNFAEKAMYTTGSSACVRVRHKIAARFGVDDAN